MTVQSAVLKSFYINMQTWVDAGCPEHPVFKTTRALCVSLMEFSYELGANSHMRKTVQRELLDQFRDAGLLAGFPFNSEILSFMGEQALGDHYQNPARLAWIKQHAEEEPHA